MSNKITEWAQCTLVVTKSNDDYGGNQQQFHYFLSYSLLKPIQFRFLTIVNKEVSMNSLWLPFYHYIQNTTSRCEDHLQTDSRCVPGSLVGGLSQLPWRDPDVKKDVPRWFYPNSKPTRTIRKWPEEAQDTMREDTETKQGSTVDKASRSSQVKPGSQRMVSSCRRFRSHDEPHVPAVVHLLLVCFLKFAVPHLFTNPSV